MVASSPAHHPLVAEWITLRRRQRQAMRTGHGPYVEGFNKHYHRLHHVVSHIFFAAERYGLIVAFTAPPLCSFEFDGAAITCVFGTVTRRLPGSTKTETRLQFAIPASHAPAMRSLQWTDERTPLLEQVDEIVAAILVSARAIARQRRQTAKADLEGRVAELLAQINSIGEEASDVIVAAQIATRNNAIKSCSPA